MAESQPRQTRLEQHGWLISRANRVSTAHAHYFTDGHSACHTWTSTTVDERAKPYDRRCPVCAEMVRRNAA